MLRKALKAIWADLNDITDNTFNEIMNDVNYLNTM